MSKIVVDAGHGGKDSGAVNVKLYEKDVTLDIALRLEGLLKARGYEVTLTRKDDTFVALSDRAKIANNVNADIFISIHCNGAGNKEAEGYETLVFEEDKLGEVIHKNMVKDLCLKDRGIKVRKDLTVLNSTKMKAVLVETAFITNDNEKAKLESASFRQKVAESLLKGVEEYFGKDLKSIVKDKFGFDDNTMLYFEMYRYGDALLKRLAEN